jgi:hypothetical protein
MSTVRRTGSSAHSLASPPTRTLLDEAEVTFVRFMGYVCSIAAVICVAPGLTTPSLAQRTELRDKNGNLEGSIQLEGNRAVLRDKAGNRHGYWQQEGSQWVHRDNSGNLLDRQQIKPR